MTPIPLAQIPWHWHRYDTNKVSDTNTVNDTITVDINTVNDTNAVDINTVNDINTVSCDINLTNRAGILMVLKFFKKPSVKIFLWSASGGWTSNARHIGHNNMHASQLWHVHCTINSCHIRTPKYLMMLTIYKNTCLSTSLIGSVILVSTSHTRQGYNRKRTTVRNKADDRKPMP